jgi:F-type H+-transporting ATPase subunit gamma
MAAQLRAVRRRISTVQSIAKITRAQELIASSRIVRAQQRMRAAEPYARELTRAVEAVISRSSNVTHPFTEEPENPTRAAVLILTSDQRLRRRLQRERAARVGPAAGSGCGTAA